MGHIFTRGEGLRLLRNYYELHGSDLPSKLPLDTSKWSNGAKYSAPHGYLIVRRDGSWTAVFSLKSVVDMINKIAGLEAEARPYEPPSAH
jgi:hypothetical protein